MAKPKTKAKKRKQKRVKIEVNGQTITKAINYYTLEEYEEKKKAAIREAERIGKETFREIAELWQAQHDEEIQIYTASCYRRPLQDCIDAFGDLLPGEITPLMIQQLLDRMNRQGYAKQTINLRKIVLTQVFNFAIFNGLAGSNPAAVCKAPKTAKKTGRELPSEEDVAAIRAHPDGLIGLFCNLLLYSGLRREEALALTYEDIDFAERTIRVNKAIVFDGNRGVVRPGAKSKAGNRTVPLLDPLAALLDPAGKGPLFYPAGDVIKKSRFDKAFQRYRQETGISATCHQLRHYFCTLCFEADLDEKDLADIMGHSKVSLSKEIYTHIRAQRKQQSSAKLNALFSAG